MICELEEDRKPAMALELMKAYGVQRTIIARCVWSFA